MHNASFCSLGSFFSFSLQLNTYVSSHLPDYWEKPDEFNPYRFDDEELLKRYSELRPVLAVFAEPQCNVCCCSESVQRKGSCHIFFLNRPA